MVSHKLTDTSPRSAPTSKKTGPSQRQESTADELLSKIESTMGESWLPGIYRDRILALRTRSYVFPATARRRSKQSPPEVQHTLLGIELKVGHTRMLCPDLSTARYLAIF